MKGKLFIISGPSGAGKTTIAKKLLSIKELNLKKLITYTTRKKRGGEIDGKDYNFISKKEFMKNKDEFFEMEEVYGNYYGSKKDDMNSIINLGKNILLVIDVKGAINIKKRYPSSILIFISPENIDSLRNMLTSRKTDSESVIKNRLKIAKREISKSKKFDFVVINKIGKIEEAIRDIKKIILR